MVLVLGYRQRFTLLWLYALAGLVIDLTALILKTNGIKQYWLGNIFVLLELVCITLYYRRHVFYNRKEFLGFSSLLIIVFVVHTIYNSIFEFNQTGTGVLCAIYIGYGVVGYLQILRNKNVVYLNHLPFFWINTAFFLYSTANCLLFLFATYLKAESLELMMNIWFKYFVSFNILRYIFIGVGLYKTSPHEA